MTKLLRHEHLLVQAKVKKPIKDEEIAKQWLKELIEKIGMELAAGPVAYMVDTPGNRGITATACLMTSHTAIHIWDEVEPALVAFDLYSCSSIDLNVVWKHFLVMEPDEIIYKFLDRESNFDTVITSGIKLFGLNGVGPDSDPGTASS